MINRSARRQFSLLAFFSPIGEIDNMANIKNFGIVGVGSDVQFGKGGARLIQEGGAFSLKNSQGNAFTKLQVADATDSTGAVTLQQLTNAISNVTSSSNSIQTEINAIETSVGLNSDGTFASISGSNYTDAATSVLNAISLLDSALFNEIDTVSGSVQTVSDNLAQEILDRANAVALVAQDLSDETNARVAADSDLTNAIASTDANVAAVASDLANTNSDVSALTGRVETLENASTNVGDRLDNLESNVAVLQSNVVTLTSDIANTNQAVSDETNARVAADAVLTNAVAAVAADLTSNVATLNNSIAAVAADLASNVATLTQADSDETNARVAADAVLTNAVAAVAADLVSNVSTLNNSITSVSDELSALEANVVLKDGSVAFTGALDMGNHVIANVAAPVAGTDAVNKDYVTNAISTLGNAFKYRGTLTPGASDDTAFDLSTLTYKDAGDYYKAIGSGWVSSDGTIPNAFYVNTNDGIVKNDADSWDKIDNTDSTTTGTSGEITVSGSVDTGYTVGIDSSYTAARQLEVSNEANARVQGDSDEANARILADNTLTQAVSDETNARVAADAVLTNAVASTNANVAAVASDLANTNSDVSSLTGRVEVLENSSTNVGDRLDNLESNVAILQSNVVTLTSDIANTNQAVSDETNARVAADAVLTNAVAAVAADLTSNVATLVQADSDLANAIVASEANSAALVSSEANTRAAADLVLTNAVASTNANVAAVASNVANAQSEIDAIEAGAGLSTAGAYVANTGSTYLANATSLFDADNILDNAVAALANSIANLQQDEIVSLDGLTSVKSDNTGVQFNGNVGGVKTQTGVITTSNATDTTFNIDLSTAGKVAIRAEGTNVDLRLAGSGTGHVIIGDTGNGFIQPDAGYDLVLAGGASGGAVTLVSNDIEMQSESGDPVAKFLGTTSATSFASFTNSNSSVTVAADGSASNVDLVFAPKGSGSISASGSKIANVANASANGDAVNLGQLNTAISTAATGSIKAISNTVMEIDGSGAISLGTVDGTVTRIKVLVTGSFDVGATLTVGTSGNASELAAASDIDEGSAGIYLVETIKNYSGDELLVTLANAGIAGTGTATVYVEYISA